jgi:hypothetical protein
MSLAPLFDHFRTIDFYAPPRTVEPDASPHQASRTRLTAIVNNETRCHRHDRADCADPRT